MSSMSDPRLVRIAVIGALVAALGLAGCGRKGGLDPPPGVDAAVVGLPVLAAQANDTLADPLSAATSTRRSSFP